MDQRLVAQFVLIEKNKADLLDQLESIDLEILQKAENPGKWSVIQVMNHLILSESASLRYLRKKIGGKDSLKEALWIDLLKALLLNSYLRSPFKFKAPGGLTAPDNGDDVKRVVESWDTVRKDFKAFLEEYPTELYNKVIYKHPVVGRIRLIDTISFLNGHQSRHIRQIGRILRKVNPEVAKARNFD
ncbi:MAG: DinB family protein [Cyclobacteriaceae bacterium]|nr:DinB family protein [Cyclobacteriaceae bacterium HetDA_MAG_MS6]